MTKKEAFDDTEVFPILVLMVADVYEQRPDLTVQQAKLLLARMARKYEIYDWPDAIKDYATAMFGPEPEPSEEE